MTTEVQQDSSSAWRPDKPDEQHPNPLKGTLVDLTAGVSDYGEYPLLTIEDDDGRQWTIHAFHSVLRSNLARRRPKIGDPLTINYLGKTPDSPSRRGYHNYQVTGGSSVGYDWSQDLPQGSAAPLQVEGEIPIQSQGLPAQQVPSQPAVPTPAVAGGQQFGDDIPF